MILNERLWTIRQLAEFLHMHPDSVRNRIEAGEIRASDVGTTMRSVWVVRQSDVDTYLNAKTNESSGKLPRRRKAVDREFVR